VLAGNSLVGLAAGFFQRGQQLIDHRRDVAVPQRVGHTRHQQGMLIDHPQVKALLPHVDRHLPVHSLRSIEDLARAIRAGQRTSTPIH
jgi:hypothetical protein